jgi:FkbH-like protein
LIGVASKNNPELVEEIFKSRELLLKKDRIFPFEVNWGLKSESIGRILEAWTIGPESVVFVDDSAMELDQVKSIYPKIECLQFPTVDEKKAWEQLYQLRDLFGKETIQEEDVLRLDSLRSAALHRGREQSAGGQPEDLLRAAQAELTVCFASNSNDSRAFELVNKTNQFNLNGRRYTLGEWKTALEENDRFLMTVSYIDKYGPLGKIAVIKGRRESGKAFIDTWVMSCRAFGRRIEYKCLDLLFQKTGADEIAFDFLPTPRNEPAREFFESLLGEKPHEGFLLSRKAFSEKCLPLYQTIKEMEHGESE